MSALGHKRTSEVVCVMSALPPKADIADRDYHVRFVQKTDLGVCLRYRPCSGSDDCPVSRPFGPSLGIIDLSRLLELTDTG